MDNQILEEKVIEAQEEFNQLLEAVEEMGEGWEITSAEEEIFSGLLGIGRTLLEVYIAKAGNGYRGPRVEVDRGVELTCQGDREVDYLSIFGEVEISRSYYYKKGEGGQCPLDYELNIPERKYSYLLEKWLLKMGVRESYDEALEGIGGFLGIRVPKRSMEEMVKEVSEEVDGYYEQKGSFEGEGEIMVIGADGKGVPMRREGVAPKRKRLKKGEKQTKKKEATVGIIYSLEGSEGEAEEPRMINKEVFGTLEGKDKLFERLKGRAEVRGLDSCDKGAYIADGDVCLWKKKEEYFPQEEGIIDFYHVSEYLWDGAHLFLQEGSTEAEEWVKEKEGELLEGKVGYIIGGLKQMITKAARIKTKRQREKLNKIIGYLLNNKDHMRYDKYKQEGYPIGSGVVEAGCRNLVADRMERTGMRWKKEGAEAMLKLRGVYLSGDWEDFWDYYIKRGKVKRELPQRNAA